MKDQMGSNDDKGIEETRFELVWKTKDGKKIHTLGISERNYTTKRGVSSGSIGILTDITYLKKSGGGPSVIRRKIPSFGGKCQ